jgi:hypothetical protein
VKFTLDSILQKPSADAERRWPGYVLGRVRTSTVVLIVAFVAVWWVHTNYRTPPPEKPPSPNGPVTQVAPPGFKPDPGYTWVPRDRVDRPRPVVTDTPTPTEAPPPTTTTTPPFVLPTLPCIPPFCMPSPSPSTPTSEPPQQPPPGPGPSPTPLPPAR